jgi:hypothetical protein
MKSLSPRDKSKRQTYPCNACQETEANEKFQKKMPDNEIKTSLGICTINLAKRWVS